MLKIDDSHIQNVRRIVMKNISDDEQIFLTDDNIKVSSILALDHHKNML